MRLRHMSTIYMYYILSQLLKTTGDYSDTYTHPGKATPIVTEIRNVKAAIGPMENRTSLWSGEFGI